MHTKRITAFGLVLVAVAMAGCSLFGSTIKPPDPYRPELIISQLGEFAFQAYVKLSKASLKRAHTQLAGRVVQLVSKHLKGSGVDWHVQVIDSSEVFAHAFPGGGVIVSSALLDAAQDDDGRPDPALIGVAVTHEIAHVTQHHFLERLKRSAALLTTVVATMKAGDAFDAKTTAGILSVMGIGAALPFDKEQEYEADRIAAELLGPKGRAESIRFWRGLSTLPGANVFSLTHPSVDERIARLEQRFAQR